MRTFKVPVSKVVPGDVVISGMARYEVDDVEIFPNQCIIHGNAYTATLFYRPTDKVSVLARHYETMGEWVMLCVVVMTVTLLFAGVI